MPAARGAVDGADVRTVEGLAGAASLHAVQQAFVNRSALQCGICTPGHIMAACALLDKNPEPSDAEIRASVESVYCRCTGYVRIARRITKRSRSRARRASMNQRDPDLRPAGSLLVVGKDVPRTDAIPKVTGAAQYVADLHCPACCTRPCCAARIRTPASSASTPPPLRRCPASRRS